MPKVSFILNGKQIETESGKTILEAARENGIDIPTLCHDPRLKPTAACRLCMVEIEKARGPVPACNTVATEGMVVKSQSDAISNSRRIALELLLSDHYGDCVSPCQLACPAGIDIQGQLAYIAEGRYFDALKLIKESNPLPLVCGRVCPRFCEKKCRRNLVDTPVAINMTKRFVADMDLKSGKPYTPKPKTATGRKVAVIGGGPAGLTAAYYLALEGHSVTIFESSSELGGMLRYGIPEYRLPKATLDKEIASITKLCKEVRCNAALGRNFTIDSLAREDFEAIFLALGAQADQKMNIPGEDLAGVYSGIGFLRDVIDGKKIELGQKVVVVGGGNTAIDAARTALRLGAAEVTLVYRRSRQEMPANNEEIEGAEHEGVKFQFLTNPTKIIGSNGKVNSIECVRMALGAPDASGRRKPEAVTGSEFNITVSSVIMAVGQTIDTSCVTGNSSIKLSKRGGIEVDPLTMQTNLPGVFSGGDCASGPATAVEAIGAGRRAAIYIDQYLKEGKVTPQVKPYNCSKGENETIDRNEFNDVKQVKRAEMPSLKAKERKNSFQEIELGIDAKTAQKEANRCLSCGCQDVFECKLRELATEYKVNDKKYAGRKQHYEIKKNEHPFISRDRNKCILCGRCVRICSELEGASALGFAHRGIATTIEPSMELPLVQTSCDSCGQCVSTCPTGAIVAKNPLAKPGPFKSETIDTVCPNCGIGCNIEAAVCGDRIIEVRSPIGSDVNNGSLCRKGAFDIAWKTQENRLKTPKILLKGKPVDSDWQSAISTASSELKRIKKNFGDGSIAVLVSSAMTNEEYYLSQKMARAALGTNNLACLSPFIMKEYLSQSLGDFASTLTYNDILTSDLILNYDGDLHQDYPIVSLKVRDAVSRGSKLIVLNSSETQLDSIAGIKVKTDQEGRIKLLLSVIKYLISNKKLNTARIQGFSSFAAKFRKLADIDLAEGIPSSELNDLIAALTDSKYTAITVNADTITPLELDLLKDILVLMGNHGGILLLRSAANTQGMLDMGISPENLPGWQPLTKESREFFASKWEAKIPAGKGKNPIEILEGIRKGDIKAVVVFGKDTLCEVGTGIFDKVEFSLLIDPAETDKAPYATVTLPGAIFSESEGSYTNCEGRIEKLNQVLKPAGGKQNWEIIAELSTALGYPMRYRSAGQIFKEIVSLVPQYKAAKDGFRKTPKSEAVLSLPKPAK